MKFLVLALLITYHINTVLSESCSDDVAQTKHAIHLSSGRASIQHYNIILMGATGNLAAKYLWSALFNVFQHHYSKDAVNFQIYAASRKESSAARRQISRLLLNLVDCKVEIPDEVDQECVEQKKKFIEAVQFQQLKTERDFQTLADKLYENTQSVYGIEPGSPNTYEQGRLVYMSIPPSTYAVTAKYINAYLRPKIGRPWFRVVIEKPFGHNFESANNLASELRHYFNEMELYRIDHYLAKTVIKQILPFRYKNRDLYEPLWNRDYIEQVDIVMKEKEDVAGKIDSYNEVGVIRDVMQNHMTEMLTLIASDLSPDSGNISSLIESKVRLLGSLRIAGRGAVLTGQYRTYNLEWLRERNDSVQRNISHTPTFAAVVLNIDSDRWRDVPFVLVSGKKLDEKSSYIRIRFRPNRFCLRASNLSRDVNEPWCMHSQQIVFRVGDSSSRSFIAVSKGLPAIKGLAPEWSIDSEKEGALFGLVFSQLSRYVSDTESDPYVELIEAVMIGARHLFVSTDSLLAAWKIWTKVLHEASQTTPRQYMGRGKDTERLDFMLAPVGSSPVLRYWVSEMNVLHYDIDPSKTAVVGQIPDTFRNSVLTSGTEHQIVSKLAQEIARLSVDKVSHDRNSKFHLAVSGGKTPEMLFHELASTILPWKHLHVWMVDERCDGSNFETLERHLLSRVSDLPYRNIHPMLVEYIDQPCEANAQIYENTIRRFVPNDSFDFVILGLGTDGHTASLFPGLPSVLEKTNLVTMVQIGNELEHNRITLTLPAINRAKNVAVLVTGREKNAILRQINEHSISDSNRYPIVGVNVTAGWFVDHEALFG